MIDFKPFFEVVLSTEYHRQSGRPSQLSLYSVTLPMAFFGMALFWAWILQSFLCPIAAGMPDIAVPLVQLAGVVLACAAIFLLRFSMRLRYLYRVALASSCSLALLQAVAGGLNCRVFARARGWRANGLFAFALDAAFR